MKSRVIKTTPLSRRQLIAPKRHLLGKRYKVVDVAFAVELVKATPITAEILASAEKRANRARAARKAGFLDKFRTNSSVAA